MSDLEDDFNPRAHNTLLQAISGLKKTQHIRQTTRNEPKIKQSEFELVKGTSVTTKLLEDDAAPASSVAINDLVQVLRKKKKHIDAGKLLKNVQRTKKVFQKPLEKPAAERIKRQIGYDKVKTKLERWDAVVARNRVAEQQIFPLPSETVYIDTTAYSKSLDHSIKSDLRREMEAAEEKLRQLKRERDGDFENENDLEKRRQELHQIKLTREELISRRKELAYLKIRESQQSAKARMRNKIKSKKYHKLLKRQKLQAQLKEFEQLQKTNPEAALEKLEELEKSRVLERATLRHKNTGSWAKNLQVRAKYDKDVRKDLSEQLQLSRELTQKSKLSDDEQSENNDDVKMNENEEPADEMLNDDPNNPWLTVRGKSQFKGKDSKEQTENWRKYWMDKNHNDKLLAAYKMELETAMDAKDFHMELEENNKVKSEEQIVVEGKAVQQNATKKKTKTKNIEKQKKVKTQKKRPKFENGWLVEELKTNDDTNKNLPDIDDLFDDVEERMQHTIQEKLKKLRKEAKRLSQKPKKLERKRKHDAMKNLKDLSFKNKAKRPMIDEELGIEETDKKAETNGENKTAPGIPTQTTKTTNTTNGTNDDAFIDPTNFPNVVTLKQAHLQQALTVAAAADFEVAVDDDVGLPIANHQMTISEAFEDDDIIADFGEEKQKDSKLKNTEIDLNMPGWGSWAGAGIDTSQQEKKRPKRLVLKLAPEERRRDENKGELYINEEAGKQSRSHLVSDLPFPFTSVQDYEASIRAPIGRNFVTETAFRMLTRPAVITRKGTIIEPMDESELLKKPKRPSNPVDYRIQQAEKVKQQKNVAAVK